MRRAVIFDGDDTLWLTEALYDVARDAVRALVEDAGFDGARWEELERELDVANVAHLGHSPERFPTSCVEALDEVAAAAGQAPAPELRVEVRDRAATVFTADAPLRAGVEAVLAQLEGRGVRLALLTKGDPEVQRHRVSRSGLAAHFELVEIVPAKTADDFRRVVARLGLDPVDVLSVGNSIRSDVLPSIEAGVDAVWIPAHVWEYERSHDADGVGCERISDLAEVLDLLG